LKIYLFNIKKYRRCDTFFVVKNYYFLLLLNCLCYNELIKHRGFKHFSEERTWRGYM